MDELFGQVLHVTTRGIEAAGVLVRQYFPRATNFAQVSQAQLDDVALWLNQRPRKPWTSKRPPIGCPRCCSDQLNPPPLFRYSAAVAQSRKPPARFAVASTRKRTLALELSEQPNRHAAATTRAALGWERTHGFPISGSTV